MGLVVDLFAGGGGASEGIRLALGRDPDIAINHDPLAVSMHRQNHPETQHYCQDVFRIHPLWVTRNLPVDLLWASPDCTHHSKARGGKPREKRIRDLAWVVVEWAHAVKPSLILLENVEEFREWGPLDEDNQPIKALKGTTFDTWVRQIRRCGYRVEWRELRACDYGAPTTRKRLFLIAKRDCEPIIWPNPTHGAPGDKKVLSGVLKPWRTAAECLDFSLPCPSVFMSREEARAYQKHTGIRVKRPLAEKTMARIAKGIKRFVLDVADPFILNLTHGGRVESLGEPLRTVTSAHRGEKALVAPHLLRHFGQSTGNATTSPVGTITAGGGGKIGLITSHMVKFRGSNIGHDLREPAHTISAGGMHAAEARAFLIKYYGQGTGSDLREPTPTVTALDRFGLVMIHGEPYRIVDVGMRMLQPRELFRAQGFADDYVIERGSDGKKLSKTTQVSLCGNSVCPPIAAALVTANMGHFSVDQAVA